MNTIVSIVLWVVMTIAFIYVLATAIVYSYHFLRYQYEVIKVIISRNKRLKSFYSLLHKHQNDLKPFLEDLDLMIHKLLSSPGLTFSERNIILDRYHFYESIIERIVNSQKVKKVDLIEFARLHKEYVDVVKDFKRMNNDKFYEENKFFDINLN